jgi:glucose/arabinose dehydrogenase
MHWHIKGRHQWLGAAGIAVSLSLAVPIAPASAQLTRAPAAPASQITVDVVAEGLEHPWALQFLPDGRFLVTERPGRVRIVTSNGRLSEPLAGVPRVSAAGQGGLLDIALDPAFANTSAVYFAYSEPRANGSNGTAVARARLAGDAGRERIEGAQVIFRQEPGHRGGLHFGARLAFAPDGHLFITLGERFEMHAAQDLGRHWGKVVRIAADGSVPADNPFAGTRGARPEIWSTGHRNPQAAAFHPGSGALWVVEHGPRGGDEINIVARGANYGWPVVGYGIDYSGRSLHKATHKDGMIQPIYYWAPSIAPSGMAFSTGGVLPGWRGNLLVGALAGQALHRLVLDGDRVIAEEVLLNDRGWRIRDVRQGPDGAIWILTDAANGRLVRISS